MSNLYASGGLITFEFVEREIAKNPEKLLGFLQQSFSRLRPFELSSAAEAIGVSADSMPLLRRLLEHEDATVREGVLLGLVNFPDRAEAAIVLKRMAEKDSSSVIRDLALNYFNDLTDRDD